MLNPVMADLFSKIMPTQVQTASSGKSMVDQTFQNVFNSLQQTSAGHAAAADKASKAVSKKSSSKEQNSGSGNNDNSSGVEAASDNASNASDSSKADKAKETDSKKEDASSTASANKAAEALNQIKEKLEALKQNDPAGYNDLISNAGSMSVKDILTKLGFNQEQMTSIATALNVNLDDSNGGKDFMAALLNNNENSSTANAADLQLPEAASQNIPGEAATKSFEQVNAAPKSNDIAAAKDETKSQQPQPATAEVKRNNTVSNEKRECDTGANPEKDNTPKNNTTANTSADTQQTAQGPSLMEKTAKEAALNPNAANPQAAAQFANNQTANAEHASQQAGDKVAAAQSAKNNAEGAILNSTSTGSSKTESAQGQPKTPEAPKAAFERMLANQVVEKAKIITRPNGTTNMTLRLDPPSLGKVDMRLEVTEDHVRAVMIAENKDVKNALQNNIEHLKNSLSQSGIKVDEIQVATAGDSSLRNNTTAHESGHGSQGGKNGYANRGRGGVGGDEAGEIASAPARRHHAGVLDIVA